MPFAAVIRIHVVEWLTLLRARREQSAPWLRAVIDELDITGEAHVRRILRRLRTVYGPCLGSPKKRRGGRVATHIYDIVLI